MKTNYTIKTIFTAIIVVFLSHQVQAQFRIVQVDPAADEVTIRNFGNTTESVASHRLCSLITYRTISSQTTVVSGSLNLAPNAEVTISIAGNWLNDAGADLGLYVPTGSFGIASNMIDFVQWGSGGNGRESLAVANGFWTAGTFINVAPPYQFNGGVSDFGVGFWDTLLSVDDLIGLSNFNLYPNPTKTILNLELNSSDDGLIYQVFDILGKQVLNGNVNTTDLSQIDVSSLNSGLYLIKVSTGDKNETKRFIKN